MDRLALHKTIRSNITSYIHAPDQVYQGSELKTPLLGNGELYSYYFQAAMIFVKTRVQFDKNRIKEVKANITPESMLC